MVFCVSFGFVYCFVFLLGVFGGLSCVGCGFAGWWFIDVWFLGCVGVCWLVWFLFCVLVVLLFGFGCVLFGVGKCVVCVGLFLVVVFVVGRGDILRFALDSFVGFYF